MNRFAIFCINPHSFRFFGEEHDYWRSRKTYLHATIPLLILIGFFAIPAYGDVGNSPGISIRVYVPNEMRLENEIDHIYVVRIENRGNVAVPVLNTLTYWWDGRDEPIQSRVQTRKEANAGTPLAVGNWDAIMRQAQPSELRKDPSMLGPGMAIELTDAWLATPLLPDGESRIVIQIGPQQFAYSNWVNVQVLPKEDNSDWPVVAERELAKAPRDGFDYVTHEEASGIWLFARSNQRTTAFWRVCRLPNGATPMWPPSLVKETSLARRQPHRDAIHRHNDAVLGGEDICRPHVKYDRIVPNKRI